MNHVDDMDALVSALSGAQQGAGDSIREMCRQSAAKAIQEVLDTLLLGAQRDPRTGVVKLRYTEISEGVLSNAVRQAIDNCCD